MRSRRSRCLTTLRPLKVWARDWSATSRRIRTTQCRSQHPSWKFLQLLLNTYKPVPVGSVRGARTSTRGRTCMCRSRSRVCGSSASCLVCSTSACGHIRGVSVARHVHGGSTSGYTRSFVRDIRKSPLQCLLFKRRLYSHLKKRPSHRDRVPSAQRVQRTVEVPQIQDQTVEVAWVIPQERIKPAGASASVRERVRQFEHEQDWKSLESSTDGRQSVGS